MVSTSTMNNFPSPWRLNYAGEVVRDVDVEETLHKVSPERKTFFSSDADAKSTTNKGKRESWFRIATKSNEKGDGTSNFPSIENLLDNMQCISCGPVGENTGDGKKKNRFLPTLNISRNGRKRTNDDKSKKETKKDQASFTKDSQKGPTSEEPKTRWFQKKKQENEPESSSYDVWGAIMPSSCTSPESDPEKEDKKGKNEKEKQNKKSKIGIQWFRLFNKDKQEEKVPIKEKAKGFYLNEISAMITALVNREAEQSEDKGERNKDAIKQADAKKTDANEIDPSTESNLAQWYERLKLEGEGYIRFVTGTEEDSPATAADTNDTLKREGNASLDGTVPSRSSDGTSTWVTEFSSYEVPSLLQEIRFLTSFGTFHEDKKSRRNARVSNPQEDEKFLLRKIANDPESRKNNQIGKDNTLTLQAVATGGTRDHGFKVKLHKDRALCEV